MNQRTQKWSKYTLPKFEIFTFWNLDYFELVQIFPVGKLTSGISNIDLYLLTKAGQAMESK